jgi:hypothetical protein
MKHIVTPLVWAMVLVGVLAEYGSYVSHLPPVQAAAGFSSPINPGHSYDGVFTNSSAMTSLR